MRHWAIVGMFLMALMAVVVPAMAFEPNQTYRMSLPVIEAGQQQQTPVLASPTPLPARPGLPSELVVASSGSGATLSWKTPPGDNLYYRYGMCTDTRDYCNRNGGSTFYSDPAPVGGATTKTLQFPLLEFGYTCFWVMHRFGDGPDSNLYPSNGNGNAANCVRK